MIKPDRKNSQNKQNNFMDYRWLKKTLAILMKIKKVLIHLRDARQNMPPAISTIAQQRGHTIIDRFIKPKLEINWIQKRKRKEIVWLKVLKKLTKVKASKVGVLLQMDHIIRSKVG